MLVGVTVRLMSDGELGRLKVLRGFGSAAAHRDQPASATMPHAPQTRSSLSLPIGNSKGWRALKSTIDAAGWGMPIVRSLVCVRVTAECFRPERRILMGVLDRRQAVDPIALHRHPRF